MNNDWLDIAVLEDYLDGKLDAKTMNRVEREALEDPFVAEALAGLSASPKRSLASISLLQKQLQERIADHQAEKKTKVITWQRLSIAATAAVLFIAVSVVFWMKEVAQQNQLAKQGKEVEVNLNPAAGTVVPADQGALAKNKVEERTEAAAAGQAAANAGASAEVVAKEAVIAAAVRAAKTNSYAANTQKKAAVANQAVASDVMAADVVSSDRMAKAAQSAYASPMARSMRTVSAPMIQGKVVSDVDGKPLSGVAVQALPGKVGGVAITGINGEFKIPADSMGKVYTVALSHPGYVPEQVVVRLNEPLGITLKKELNPVAAAKPVVGWTKYEQYLQENNQLTKESTLGAILELSFAIGKDGRPYDFKILRTFGAKYEKEAIRLISEGPKWELPADPKARLKLGVKF
ncbi:carboxypeptidase-like regulatory domain-containing protein [Pedobacter polysacchareus]|uniref:carboxypeptidase-like regulatory domain-containing protein n=1 Tax=Pedobacter polysacchareus TaxID=2861973 RepID=UPI001C9A2334|nr:carboxypeptidase-like regulatory domain-containing protein [Pedobacter polysacchareus]